MANIEGAMTRWRRWRLLVAVLILTSGSARAQEQNQFGGQDRADAASNLVVLAVERAIDALPIISGQSVTYRYDPESDAFGRTTQLGPTVLRSTETVEPGAFEIQVATSYFEMEHSFGPINYLFTPEGSPQSVVAKIGLQTEAHVGLMMFAASYGLAKRFEIGLSLPATIVDAQAEQSFSTRASTLGVPASEAKITGARVTNGIPDAIATLDAGLQPGGALALRRERLRSLGFDFNQGTHAGLGRVALSSKAVMLTRERLRIAATATLLLPSPNEDQFAGTNSTSITPRLIGELRLSKLARLCTDIGYSYDSDHAELRRFAWNIGASYGVERASLDMGIGGSSFFEPVHWTPQVVHGEPTTTGRALDDTTTDTTLVSFLIGGKAKLTERLSLTAGLTIPMLNLEFQPDVLATIGLNATYD